jgi:hypothetical protein
LRWPVEPSLFSGFYAGTLFLVPLFCVAGQEAVLVSMWDTAGTLADDFAEALGETGGTPRVMI